MSDEHTSAGIKSSGAVCYFISPHFDDAVFSAGALANYLKRSNRIVVVNVFTKAGPRPYTLSAKAYLKQCGYSDADLLYDDRMVEDKNALASVADKVINLNFTEALWRRKTSLTRPLAIAVPELSAVYPTYKFHIAKGKIARADFKTLEDITDQLKKIIADPDAIVFCPLAIGGHVDHVITRAACDDLFRRPIHWADFPYNLDHRNKMNTRGMTSFEFEGDATAKQNLIKKYTTQYSAMFHDGITLKPERYVYNGRRPDESVESTRALT